METTRVNPFRLGPKQAFTADQSHDYTDEQHAFHAGLMDSFPKYTGPPHCRRRSSLPEATKEPRRNMFIRTKGW